MGQAQCSRHQTPSLSVPVRLMHGPCQVDTPASHACIVTGRHWLIINCTLITHKLIICRNDRPVSSITSSSSGCMLCCRCVGVEYGCLFECAAHAVLSRLTILGMSGQQPDFDHITADRFLQHASDITAGALYHMRKTACASWARCRKYFDMCVTHTVG